MPVKPLTPCSTPGCPGRATHRGKCERHAHERERERGSAASRGYDARWRRIRLRYLQDHPYCVVCGEVATDVDHVIPRERGGSDDWSNLQSLCHRHHSAKTMRQSVRG